MKLSRWWGRLLPSLFLLAVPRRGWVIKEANSFMKTLGAVGKSKEVSSPDRHIGLQLNRLMRTSGISCVSHGFACESKHPSGLGRPYTHLINELCDQTQCIIIWFQVMASIPFGVEYRTKSPLFLGIPTPPPLHSPRFESCHFNELDLCSKCCLRDLYKNGNQLILTERWRRHKRKGLAQTYEIQYPPSLCDISPGIWEDSQSRGASGLNHNHPLPDMEDHWRCRLASSMKHGSAQLRERETPRP